MKLLNQIVLSLLVAMGLSLAACSESDDNANDHAAGDSSHTHADGSTHHDHGDGNADHAHEGEDHGHDHEGMEGDHDHAHDEIPLPPAQFGDMLVQAAQAHGAIAPGKESHLVIKLPYNDSGATIVRAWIGTEDRTLSYVGKGEYAPSHDDYDIHATAPDPLPDNAMWWIEIEKPDGTKLVGSTTPILE